VREEEFSTSRIRCMDSRCVGDGAAARLDTGGTVRPTTVLNTFVAALSLQHAAPSGVPIICSMERDVGGEMQVPV
jgi:hypothetical protein